MESDEKFANVFTQEKMNSTFSEVNAYFERTVKRSAADIEKIFGSFRFNYDYEI